MLSISSIIFKFHNINVYLYCIERIKIISCFHCCHLISWKLISLIAYKKLTRIHHGSFILPWNCSCNKIMNIPRCNSGTVQIGIYRHWFNYLSSEHFSEIVEYGREIDKLLEEYHPSWFIAVRVWLTDVHNHVL